MSKHALCQGAHGFPMAHLPLFQWAIGGPRGPRASFSHGAQYPPWPTAIAARVTPGPRRFWHRGDGRLVVCGPRMAHRACGAWDGPGSPGTGASRIPPRPHAVPLRGHTTAFPPTRTGPWRPSSARGGGVAAYITTGSASDGRGPMGTPSPTWPHHCHWPRVYNFLL